MLGWTVLLSSTGWLATHHSWEMESHWRNWLGLSTTSHIQGAQRDSYIPHEVQCAGFTGLNNSLYHSRVKGWRSRTFSIHFVVWMWLKLPPSQALAKAFKRTVFNQRLIDQYIWRIFNGCIKSKFSSPSYLCSIPMNFAFLDFHWCPLYSPNQVCLHKF